MKDPHLLTRSLHTAPFKVDVRSSSDHCVPNFLPTAYIIRAKQLKHISDSFKKWGAFYGHLHTNIHWMYSSYSGRNVTWYKNNLQPLHSQVPTLKVFSKKMRCRILLEKEPQSVLKICQMEAWVSYLSPVNRFPFPFHLTAALFRFPVRWIWWVVARLAVG